MSGAPANRVESAGEAPARRWSFGPAVLDERTLELTVNGEVVTVERKPLEVLLFLLHHAGEVVTKDEILEAVWPGRILTETVLTKAIGRIREALGDESQTLIKTQHGYGYRLIAPVKVEASTAPSLPRFDFKPGDSPPLRPRWKLEECLGTGGHGEAWRARHEKTREVRVYKFALDSTALGSLKREITIYRLLHDALPERTDFVSILDWNLEEPPYFLEIEHAGQNLVQWAEAQGGLPNVPLETRLEIAAQIAEALAAAHSVGVLHKDLKPSNVLVMTATSAAARPAGTESVGRPAAADGGIEQPANTPRPTIKLSDFGSGGVLDPGRLEAFGITRQGFTQTVKTDPTTSGTPIYFAPEVMAGQPFTVQADIYALGVMLYQLIVGDLKKPLAPGWEQAVNDELLRDDISSTAAGDPAIRLSNAAQLSQRLRTLTERRALRERQKAAAIEAQRQEQTVERLRARRVWMYTAFVVLLGGLAASSWLFVDARRAKNQAVRAGATSEAVSGFLEDVLWVDPWGRPSREMTVRAALDRTVSKVGQRLRDQPAAAARVRLVLGRRYIELGQNDLAADEFKRALAFFDESYGQDSERSLLVREQLGWAYFLLGRYSEALAALAHVRKYWERQLTRDHPRLLLVRARIGRILIQQGRFDAAAVELQAVIDTASDAGPISAEVEKDTKLSLGLDPDRDTQVVAIIVATALRWLGSALRNNGDFVEGERVLQESIRLNHEQFGKEDFDAAQARVELGRSLAAQGKYEEARRELVIARDQFDSWLLPEDYYRYAPRHALADLYLEQRQPAKALAALTEAMALCGTNKICLASIYDSFGSAHHQQRQPLNAIDKFETSLTLHQRQIDPGSLVLLGVKVRLADALRDAGRVNQARSLLAAIPSAAVSALPKDHPVLAELERVQGLLWQAEGEYVLARNALQSSLQIALLRYGQDHWRTKRAREELARVAAVSAAKAAGSS